MRSSRQIQLRAFSTKERYLEHTDEGYPHVFKSLDQHARGWNTAAAALPVGIADIYRGILLIIVGEEIAYILRPRSASVETSPDHFGDGRVNLSEGFFFENLLADCLTPEADPATGGRHQHRARFDRISPNASES